MYYNVVVADGDMMDEFYNQLVFYFGDNKEKAMRFAELVLSVSDYRVSILPFKEEKDE